jgi:glycosyltransferase involved in cell wall biosynthesis
MKNILKIAIVVNVIPSYREGFYTRLFARDDLHIRVYCQEKTPNRNLKTIHSYYPNNVILLKSFTTKGEKFAWQSIPWIECLTNYDVVFIEGNPRYLSHAILASLLRIMRKNVVLWTMAHSFSANSVSENIRLFWSRFFDNLFVYTDTEVDYLRNKGFNASYIVGMNNGLDQKLIDKTILKWTGDKLTAWQQEQGLKQNTLLLSCARLEPKNKFQKFVQALPEIVAEFPDLLWCVIGSGADHDELVTMVQAANITKHVRFIGEIYNENELAPWFLSSKILIHPAAIGLSILHAFGYGLPVITHGNWTHHGPEYAAFKLGLTGRNFVEDDVNSLSEEVIKLLKDNESLKNMKNYVKTVARGKYNVDIMVERFVNLTRIVSSR